MKINRNSICPCGSGKIFKKCCANLKKEDRGFNDPLIYFIKNNNCLELLEFISFLQLIPENSSKIIKLENIQHKIIKNLHDNFQATKIDYKVLKDIIDKNYDYEINEDPSESCFSENIMFFNGNNIVFPGIANNFTEVNQLILDSIFLTTNNISDKCKKEIEEGTVFILFLYNKIAKRLGIERFEFNDDYRGKITFPKSIKVEEFKNLFSFSQNEIDNLINELKIEYNPIKDISIDYKQINQDFGKESELIKKPFIIYDNSYYLALPSSQMFSLNIFLNSKIKEHNCLNEFRDIFLKTSKMEGDLVFRKMGWKLAYKHQEKIDFDADVWQFDTNKYAIVYYALQSNIENDIIYESIENYIKKHKEEDSFILVSISSNYDLEKPQFTRQPYQKDFEYQMIISLQDLKRLNIIWNLKQLDIWKYLKAKDRAEKKGLGLSPAFSILTYFSYYKKNENSFFHSDDKTPNYIHFTYDIQGNRIIESLQKEDRHLIHYITDDGNYGYLPVRRYNEIPHIPLYFADTFINGELKLALTKYNFTIWITSHKSYDLESKNFIDAIAYWLNEFYSSLQNIFNEIPNIPINIEVVLEDSFYNYTTEDISKNKDSKINFEYKINFGLNKISVTIPSNIHNTISKNDNYGEKILMDVVLKSLFEIFSQNFNINLNIELIPKVLEVHMPLGMAKMIIAGNSLDDIKLDNRFINNTVKRLNKADTSIVLEEMINWMNIDVPENIDSKEEKIGICIKGIDTLINKAKEVLSNFNSIELLKLVILRNETLLNNSAFKQMRTVSYYECFKNYTDAIKDYLEEDSKNIRTALSIRCLIEFIIAEPYYGTKKPNNDDVDLLVALVDEIIFLGTTKDLIGFDLDNPEMGRLPSGRLGIDKDYYDKINIFSTETKKDEHYEYLESYKPKSSKGEDNKENDLYYDKIDSIFKEEFGIELFKVRGLILELAHYCFENKNSYLIFNDDEFKTVLEKEFNLTEIEVLAVLSHFILNTRGEINHPPKGYEYPDIFPWRYNRQLSYLSRPIIRIKDESGAYKIIISARHLVSSIDNFFAVFFNGSLKIDSKFRKINSLLAERNNIKGKQFRNEVSNWLTENTFLEVVPYEFKIPVKGNSKNYGDVDILAFDKRKKIIYSIECKNTKQAKIIYEFQRDAKNYIDKQLPKHQNRTEWLKNNLVYLSERFKYNFSGFKVKSYLISSYNLPIKLIQDIDDITIHSFNEVKRNKIF